MKKKNYIWQQSWKVLLRIALFTATSSALAQSEHYIIEPYTTQVDQTSATIIWVAPADYPAVDVIVQPAAGGASKSVTSQPTVPHFQQSGQGTIDYVRQLTKVTDLVPGTKYQYQINVGDAARHGTFVTAIEANSETAFRFVVASDGHGGGAGGVHPKIAQHMADDAPDFIVHTGDCAGGKGDDWGGWLSYFSNGRPYLEAGTFWPVVGGHDVSPARNLRALFGFNDPAGNPSDEDSAPTYYTFTHGNVQFFVLDYIYNIEEQLLWLEDELASSTATWKFVSLHMSVFSVGSRGNLLTGIYRDFANLFEEYGVDIVIYGHDHIYERSLPFGSEGNKPVHYVITNTGGNFREIRPSPILAGGIGQQVHCYAVFDVDDNQLTMQVKDDDGNVFDTLELIQDEDGLYQPEIMDQALDLEFAMSIGHAFSPRIGMYDREDMQVEFHSVPTIGEPVQIRLDVSRFPEGSQLTMVEQDDPSGWQVETQTVDITGDTVSVTVTPPDNLVLGETSLNPALRMSISATIQGRTFDPVPVIPTLGPETLAKLEPSAILEEIGVERVVYSNNLVPATRLGIRGEGASGRTHSRGIQQYYTWLEGPSDSLELSVMGGGIDQERYRELGDFDLELYYPADHGDGDIVASAPIARTGQSAPVLLQSPHHGAHLLRYNDSRDITSIGWDPDVALTWKLAHDNTVTDHSETYNLVFYVPRGTREVVGHALSGSGTMLDASGNTLLDLDGYRGYFNVPVAEGQDGQIWQLRDFGDDIYFLNIPPYAAPSVEQLLIPNEVVEADATALLEPALDLVAHFLFDEDTGHVAADSSGNDLDATFTSEPVWGPGQLENAATLSGSSSMAQVPDDPLLEGMNRLTISFWARPTNLNGSDPSFVVSKRNSSSDAVFSIFFWTDDRLCVYLDGNNDLFFSDTVFSNDTWYHITVVYDGTQLASNRARIYVNGVLDRVASESSAVLNTNNQPLWIGHSNTGGPDNSKFNGTLDDLRIYRSALTAANVARLPDDSLHAPGALATWHDTYFTSAELADSAISGAEANPAGDGIANLIKYHLGLNPWARVSAADLPTADLSSSLDVLTLSYERARYSPDVTAAVQWSMDLTDNWSTEGVTMTVVDQTETHEEVEAHVPTADRPHLFVRLHVTPEE